MAVLVKLSWRDRVSLSAGEGEAVVVGPETRLALRSVAPEILAALHRLAPPGEAEETLAETVRAVGNVDSLARWYFHIDQFRRRGLICSTLHSADGPVATLVPLCHTAPPSSAGTPSAAHANGHARPGLHRPTPAAGFSLSRFAYLRRDGGEMVLESPLSHSRLVLHDHRAVGLIGALASRLTVTDLCRQFPAFAPATVGGLVALLEEASLVDAVHGEENTASTDEGFDSWEFHDLLFHTRSRRGRSDARFGATWRLAHQPAPPALKSFDGDRSFELHRPDLATLEENDPPFAQVQNRRRSMRKYGAEPIRAEQLGEFLYRVGRVTETWTADIPGAMPTRTMEFAARPYPSGGALYELGIYPVVRQCRDLSGGLYAYDPAQHRLHQVAGRTPEVESLLDDAAVSAGIDPRTTQVLIVLASRFRRIAWKYESIAYALTLKHVGVMIQTMYLAATAMGLAPCAVGCGDSDLFARAAGTEYHLESSVGEFLLGSRG